MKISHHQGPVFFLSLPWLLLFLKVACFVLRIWVFLGRHVYEWVNLNFYYVSWLNRRKLFYSRDSFSSGAVLPLSGYLATDLMEIFFFFSSLFFFLLHLLKYVPPNNVAYWDVNWNIDNFLFNSIYIKFCLCYNTEIAWAKGWRHFWLSRMGGR